MAIKQIGKAVTEFYSIFRVCRLTESSPSNGALVSKWLTHLPFISKVECSNLSENFSM